MLPSILLHTPRWVFFVFALLVWLGCQQWLDRQVSLWRVTLVPLVMTAMAASGVATAFGGAPLVLLAWAGAAMASGWALLQRPLPANTRYLASTRHFHVPGSAVPLVLMMGIFLTKFAVAAALGMNPELRQQMRFALGVSLAYGAFSGVFIARAARLWRLARRSNIAHRSPAVLGAGES